MVPITRANILGAHRRLSNRVIKTPCLSHPSFSQAVSLRLGNHAELFVKYESCQKSGSFKYRGAMHKLLELDDGSLRRGLVTCSTGRCPSAPKFVLSSKVCRQPCVGRSTRCIRTLDREGFRHSGSRGCQGEHVFPQTPSIRLVQGPGYQGKCSVYGHMSACGHGSHCRPRLCFHRPDR
jgi:hypothetical protein